jgi:hypothetical protein
MSSHEFATQAGVGLGRGGEPWERPRKVRDLKVDVKLERSTEGGWSFSLEDLRQKYEKQAITSYKGTYSYVCVSDSPSCPIPLSSQTWSSRSEGSCYVL